LDFCPYWTKYKCQRIQFPSDSTDYEKSNSTSKYLLVEASDEQSPLETVTTRDALAVCNSESKRRDVFFLKRSISYIDLPGMLSIGNRYIGVVVKIHVQSSLVPRPYSSVINLGLNRTYGTVWIHGRMREVPKNEPKNSMHLSIKFNWQYNQMPFGIKISQIH
jgi:hypothetical protein